MKIKPILSGVLSLSLAVAPAFAETRTDQEKVEKLRAAQEDARKKSDKINDSFDYLSTVYDVTKKENEANYYSQGLEQATELLSGYSDNAVAEYGITRLLILEKWKQQSLIQVLKAAHFYDSASKTEVAATAAGTIASTYVGVKYSPAMAAKIVQYPYIGTALSKSAEAINAATSIGVRFADRALFRPNFLGTKMASEAMLKITNVAENIKKIQAAKSTLWVKNSPLKARTEVVKNSISASEAKLAELKANVSAAQGRAAKQLAKNEIINSGLVERIAENKKFLKESAKTLKSTASQIAKMDAKILARTAILNNPLKSNIVRGYRVARALPGVVAALTVGVGLGAWIIEAGAEGVIFIIETDASNPEEAQAILDQSVDAIKAKIATIDMVLQGFEFQE